MENENTSLQGLYKAFITDNKNESKAIANASAVFSFCFGHKQIIAKLQMRFTLLIPFTVGKVV